MSESASGRLSVMIKPSAFKDTVVRAVWEADPASLPFWRTPTPPLGLKVWTVWR